MAVATTSIRVNTRLAEEAKKLLGVKSRSEAARIALREILGLRRSSKVMKKNGPAPGAPGSRPFFGR